MNYPVSALAAFDEPTGIVRALTVFNDGRGPALYAGGDFTTAGGGVAANRIAKWDGTQWSALDSGMNYSVLALTVFDDGAGPTLYAGGGFTIAGGVAANRVARWDGTRWFPVGAGISEGQVQALTVFDDGTGPAIYAGGNFSTAEGRLVNRIAKWDGRQWLPLQGGGMNGTVAALTVFDDGTGAALYAAGFFSIAGDMPANRIAKWDGNRWWPLGNGVNNGSVYALTVFDDGTGAALYAAGSFTIAGDMPANRIAKWDGNRWWPLGNGVNGSVVPLAVFNDGTGQALYAGGGFTIAGDVPANRIAKWDGRQWSALGRGMNHGMSALTVFDDGTGSALYAGGGFTIAGGVPATSIAKWDGRQWSALGRGMARHLLYAGGYFTTAGGVPANRIARWDGTQWSALGGGMNNRVSALTVFDDGRLGPALYAGGAFTTAGIEVVNHIAKWDGGQWLALGTGISRPGPSPASVDAMTVFDDGRGPALYVGGYFTTAGGVAANGIARWDGTQWSALGSGLTGFPSRAYALTVFDDGNGPALYVGGSFTSAGDLSSAYNIAKWDGTQWSGLGNGVSADYGGFVLALTVFDDGRGAALYAAGYLQYASGVQDVNNIARWDGTQWSAVSRGLWGADDATVGALTVVDNGMGSVLYAGGDFTHAGDYDALRIAKWDGTQWLSLQGGGANNSIWALTGFDDGRGPGLYAGGSFLQVGSVVAPHIAGWRCR